MSKTLAAIVAEFLEYKREVQGSRYRTVKSYEDHLRPFVAWVGDRDICDIPWREVNGWINRPARGGPSSPSTIRNRTVLTTNFYKYLVSVERLPLSHDAAITAGIRAHKAPATRKKAIPDGDFASLFLLPLSRDADPSGIGRVDLVWLGLGYYWGFRAIEIMSIRPEEVGEGFWLNFERKGPQGANFHQLHGMRVFEDDLRYVPSVLPGHERFLEALDWLRKLRHGERFLMPATQGEHVETKTNRVEWIATERDTQWLNRRLDILLRDNGLDRKLFTPHALRHSAATNLARSGASPERIMSVMNHRSYDVSLGYINSLREHEQQRVHNIRQRERDAARRLVDDD